MNREVDGGAETVSVRLRRLRREAGLSQRELSEPGVSYAYISRIEGGTRDPSVKALRKLAPKLGVSVRYLETGVESVALHVLVDDVDAELDRLGIGTHWNDLSEDEKRLLVTNLEGMLRAQVAAAALALRAVRLRASRAAAR